MAYIYKSEPFSHQRELFDTTAHMPFHGILWEQGTGKTKPVIDMAAMLYEEKEIDCLLVVAPPGVHRNWITDEIPAHMPDRVLERTAVFAWNTGKSGTKWHKEAAERAVRHDGLLVIAFSYQGFMSELGKKFVWRVLRRRRCFYAADESHHIKTPNAKRTKSIIASGKYAPYRRIMTGTPVANTPFDIYSQIRFLDEGFWRRHDMASFQAFKHHFGVWFTRAEAQQTLGYDPGYDKLIEYKNIGELHDLLKQISSRVLKEDVLDLPPKIYSKRYFEMNTSQKRAYNELKEEFITELEDGRVIDGSLAITRLLRMQQVLCGYVADGSDEPITYLGNDNPRMGIVEDLRDSLGHQVIIWCRFTEDINQIMDLLGKRAVRYDGTLSEDDCELSKEMFKGGEAQWFVGNSQKGAEGLTLNEAKTMVYYSNSFNLVHRLQSEDRAHRIGQEGIVHVPGQDAGVHYIDICCPGTTDEKTINSLRLKLDVASQVTGDTLREWL